MVEEKSEKKKSEKERPKGREDAVKVFIGKNVVIALRGGTKLTGRLEMVTNYELILTIDNRPTLVMKHAADHIKLAE